MTILSFKDYITESLQEKYNWTWIFPLKKAIIDSPRKINVIFSDYSVSYWSDKKAYSLEFSYRTPKNNSNNPLKVFATILHITNIFLMHKSPEFFGFTAINGKLDKVYARIVKNNKMYMASHYHKPIRNFGNTKRTWLFIRKDQDISSSMELLSRHPEWV